MVDMKVVVRQVKAEKKNGSDGYERLRKYFAQFNEIEREYIETECKLKIDSRNMPEGWEVFAQIVGVMSIFVALIGGCVILDIGAVEAITLYAALLIIVFAIKYFLQLKNYMSAQPYLKILEIIHNLQKTK